MTNCRAKDFQVRRADVRKWRFAAMPSQELGDGGVLLRVDAFAFTANNVSYAALGDTLQYWHFFPAPDGWGRIPAWGFGTVIGSRSDDVAEGTRYYGYFPMSTHVEMQPERVTRKTFSDGILHRAALHPLYNQYTLTSPMGATNDALQLLLRPLFITSFVLDDLFHDSNYHGAERVIISSASSKTAYGMAFLLDERNRASGERLELVGLTSSRNAAFVQSLALYDRVITYDAIHTLSNDSPALFVDFAANAEVTSAVHAKLAGALRFSSAIGYTHWDQRTADVSASIAGVAPIPFFAPAQIKKRIRDWGPGGFEQHFNFAWNRFVDELHVRGDGWLRIVRSEGAQAVSQVYDAALAGTLRPDEGHILALPE